MSRRRTSPKGALLDRGQATRERVLSVLPGTLGQIAKATGISCTSCRHAVYTLVERGQVRPLDFYYPPEGGTPRQVWGLATPKTPPSSDPWHNAWFRG